jgi:hypothetical protein
LSCPQMTQLLAILQNGLQQRAKIHVHNFLNI